MYNHATSSPPTCTTCTCTCDICMCMYMYLQLQRGPRTLTIYTRIHTTLHMYIHYNNMWTTIHYNSLIYMYMCKYLQVQRDPRTLDLGISLDELNRVVSISTSCPTARARTLRLGDEVRAISSMRRAISSMRRAISSTMRAINLCSHPAPRR